MTDVLVNFSNNDAVLAKCAEEIRRRGKNVIADIVEIGHQLTIAKDAAGHKEWLPWLEHEFDWSDQHARRNMHVYELSQSSKFNTLLNMGIDLSGVYMLAAPKTTEAARTEVLKLAKAGKVTVAEIKAIIQETKPPAKPAKKPVTKPATAPAATPSTKPGKTAAAPGAPEAKVNGTTAPDQPRHQWSPEALDASRAMAAVLAGPLNWIDDCDGTNPCEGTCTAHIHHGFYLVDEFGVELHFRNVIYDIGAGDKRLAEDHWRVWVAIASGAPVPDPTPTSKAKPELADGTESGSKPAEHREPLDTVKLIKRQAKAMLKDVVGNAAYMNTEMKQEVIEGTSVIKETVTETMRVLKDHIDSVSASAAAPFDPGELPAGLRRAKPAPTANEPVKVNYESASDPAELKAEHSPLQWHHVEKCLRIGHAGDADHTYALVMVPTRFHVPGGWRIIADYATDTERDLGFERTLDWAQQRAERDWLNPVKTWFPQWGYDVDPAFRGMCKDKNWDDDTAPIVPPPAPTPDDSEPTKRKRKTARSAAPADHESAPTIAPDHVEPAELEPLEWFDGSLGPCAHAGKGMYVIVRVADDVVLKYFAGDGIGQIVDTLNPCSRYGKSVTLSAPAASRAPEAVPASPRGSGLAQQAHLC